MTTKTQDPNGIPAEEILRRFGFGLHETAVILALNRFGASTVANLAEVTGYHQANLYPVLEGLVQRGIVVRTDERPKRYEFVPLSHFRDLLVGKVDQLLQSLEELQKQRECTKETPTLIYTLKGELEVRSKIVSMIRHAKQDVLMVAPRLSKIHTTILDELRAASKRKVRVRVVHGGRPLKLPSRVKQRIKKQITAVDLVVDGSQALLAMPDLSICGWAENPMIALQLREFLEQTWKLAHEVSK